MPSWHIEYHSIDPCIYPCINPLELWIPSRFTYSVLLDFSHTAALKKQLAGTVRSFETAHEKLQALQQPFSQLFAWGKEKAKEVSNIRSDMNSLSSEYNKLAQLMQAAQKQVMALQSKKTTAEGDRDHWKGKYRAEKNLNGRLKAEVKELRARLSASESAKKKAEQQCNHLEVAAAKNVSKVDAAQLKHQQELEKKQFAAQTNMGMLLARQQLQKNEKDEKLQNKTNRMQEAAVAAARLGTLGGLVGGSGIAGNSHIINLNTALQNSVGMTNSFGGAQPNLLLQQQQQQQQQQLLLQQQLVQQQQGAGISNLYGAVPGMAGMAGSGFPPNNPMMQPYQSQFGGMTGAPQYQPGLAAQQQQPGFAPQHQHGLVAQQHGLAPPLPPQQQQMLHYYPQNQFGQQQQPGSASSVVVSQQQQQHPGLAPQQQQQSELVAQQQSELVAQQQPGLAPPQQQQTLQYHSHNQSGQQQQQQQPNPPSLAVTPANLGGSVHTVTTEHHQSNHSATQDAAAALASLQKG